MGWQYLNRENRRDKALECFEQSLAISREITNRQGEANALSALGRVYDSLSQYGKAIDCYEQALTLYRAGNNKMAESDTLSRIGAQYKQVGQREKALAYFQQALALQPLYGSTRFFPAIKVPELGNTAICYDYVGQAYSVLGQHKKAIRDYKRALVYYTVFRDGLGAHWCLNRLGWEYESLGQHHKSLWSSKLAMLGHSKSRGVGYRECDAAALRDLGCTYEVLGQYDKALHNYQRSLSILREVKDRPSEASTLDTLMRFWKNRGKERLAIFYGKQAVNIYQDVRGNIQMMDRTIQKGFLASHESTYRELADLLIAEGRLPEAEQILDILKEDEFFDFVRRDGNQALSLTTRAELTPTEAAWERRYREIADRVTAMGTERGELLAKRSRTSEENHRLGAIEKDLEVANRAFQKQLDQLMSEADNTRGGNNKIDNLQDEAEGLMGTLGDLGLGTVAIYTLVSAEKYHVILITPNARIAGEYTIKAADLN
jgi:tetratricopeptide (TPR) repeat protein